MRDRGLLHILLASVEAQVTDIPNDDICAISDQKQDADLDSDDVDQSSLLGTNPNVSIFVSYRIAPDQILALALKRLIESALEPRPHVFVSGAGLDGLRPSSIGYKPQLQAAVQKAVAFVGIITQASKEREWIFFEAGAAWGRGQLYAPLLVGTGPGDLSSSIADYQATRAEDREHVLLLLRSLADAVGATVKAHFARRYQAFKQVLDNHLRIVSDKEGLSLSRAQKLRVDGRNDEADQEFAKLEQAAASVEEKAQIRLASLVDFKRTSVELLALASKIPEQLRETAAYRYFIGYYEPRSHIAIASLQTALGLPSLTADVRRRAMIRLASRQNASGQESAVQATLLSCLRDEDRELVARASEKWCKFRPADEPIVRLGLLLVGLRAVPSESVLTAAVEIASMQNWKAAWLALALMLEALAQNDSSMNELGRAYDALDLKSLAYRAFAEAEKRGASVGRHNAALALSSGPVAAAGLQLLEEYSGTFDSADSAQPHRLRAELEKVVNEELKKVSRYKQSGQRLVDLLSDFFDVSLSALDADEDLGRFGLTRDGADFEISVFGEARLLRAIRPFAGWMLLNHSGAEVGVVRLEGDRLVGVAFDDLHGHSPDTRLFEIGLLQIPADPPLKV